MMVSLAVRGETNVDNARKAVSGHGNIIMTSAWSGRPPDYGIAANEHSLRIPRYVEQVSDQKTITVKQALTNLKTALADAFAAEDRLKTLLWKEGLLT